MRVIAMFSGPCAADALTARGSVCSHEFNGVRVIIKTCNQLIGINSIVREILVAHGGRVAVESVEGQGTTFILMFPIPG